MISPDVDACLSVLKTGDVVLLTGHREFLETPRWDLAKLVVDTRNLVPAAEHVVRI